MVVVASGLDVGGAFGAWHNPDSTLPVTEQHNLSTRAWFGVERHAPIFGQHGAPDDRMSTGPAGGGGFGVEGGQGGNVMIVTTGQGFDNARPQSPGTRCWMEESTPASRAMTRNGNHQRSCNGLG